MPNQFQDDLDLPASGTLSIGAVDILVDTAGDTELSNIDSVDATTKAALEAGLGVKRVLSTTTGIDAKTIATTNLYTVPTGKTAVVTEAVIRVTAADTVTVVLSNNTAGAVDLPSRTCRAKVFKN